MSASWRFPNQTPGPQSSNTATPSEKNALQKAFYKFRVSPSTVGRAIGKTNGSWFGAIPGEPTVLGDSLRASPSTVGRVIGKTDVS